MIDVFDVLGNKFCSDPVATSNPGLRDAILNRARSTQVAGTHYKDMKVEPWDVVDTWPIEQQIGYHRGGALKYLMRMGSKDEQLQEIKKAAHYIQKLIEVLEHAGSSAEASTGT